jgi:mannose-6-phosphate isomerase-like protein (cupin superfamily)
MYNFSGEVRQWGEFITLANNEKATVKVMTVHPGQSLSVQMHRQRDHLYYALESGLIVQYVQEPALELYESKDFDIMYFWNFNLVTVNVYFGDKFFFPRGYLHSCRNETDEPLCFLDIAFGHYDENDIIRIGDKYGRE